MYNLKLFELSIASYKLNMDFSNPEGYIVIPKEKSEQNKLTNANHKLIELITTYKTIRNDPEASDEYKEKILSDILGIIDDDSVKINYTGLCVYFQVLRFSWNTFINSKNKLSPVERLEILRSVVNLYIDNRHDIYLEHGYSDSSLQMQSDCATSRRSGGIASNNLKSIMEKYNFKFANSYDDFMDGNTYFFPEDNKELLNEVIEKQGIDFAFKDNHENKHPDLMFKIKKHFYILEHKLASGGGGSQNQEIGEIISFIGQDESNTYVHYISCLQGDILGRLTGDENAEPKIRVQYNKILNNLKEHRSNYFLSELGLNELLANKFRNKQD